MLNGEKKSKNNNQIERFQIHILGFRKLGTEVLPAYGNQNVEYLTITQVNRPIK